MFSIKETLVNAIRNASKHNPDIQVAPACILWPDKDRQWEPVITRLQEELPELLILGDYAPDKRTGPAIWLRCVMAGKLNEVSLPKEHIPVFYLPGVSRQELRAIESCPEHIKPLAELQFRGVIWSQVNAKDWTILAYLESDQGGLGLDVARDNETKNAMQMALYRFLDEELELIKGKRLDKDYFNTLLAGGDTIRNLLQWLDKGDAFKDSLGENEWKAFIEVCRSEFIFNPQNDGVLAGAAKLAAHEGPWAAVWERFSEAPGRYPKIPPQIRKSPSPAFDLLADEKTAGGWPQWNEEQEKNLCRDLQTLSNVPSHVARKKILELDKQHGGRRNLVWAELGEAPLAKALAHLAVLADITKTNLAAGTLEDMTNSYHSQGWKADDAVIRALEHADSKAEVLESISIAIRSIYLPWAEDSACHLQKLIGNSVYPGGTCKTAKPIDYVDGECVIFVDGLRFDIGKRLVLMLESSGLLVTEDIKWAALPSVTATGKAAVTPVRDKIIGQDNNADFEPDVAQTGQSLKGGYHLKKLMIDAGWSILEREDCGTGHGTAWCEIGDIDHEGHDRGWKLAKHIDSLVAEVRDRVISLIKAGWKSVRIVTDHGWLLMPGGLPKIEMSSALTDNKWGRCASIKAGVTTEKNLYQWYWNPSHYFVLANGVSCFNNGEEYAHGGLSLQEVIIPELKVLAPKSLEKNSRGIKLSDVAWKGLRCKAVIDGDASGVFLDIRSQAGNSESSIVMNIKPFSEDGTASAVIKDDNMEGRKAFLVLIDNEGLLLAQQETIIGGR